jgi:hypothetical protein
MAFSGFINIDEFAKSLFGRHPGERRGPEHYENKWIPAFVGMTENSIFGLFTTPSILTRLNRGWKAAPTGLQ